MSVGVRSRRPGTLTDLEDGMATGECNQPSSGSKKGGNRP